MVPVLRRILATVRLGVLQAWAVVALARVELALRRGRPLPTICDRFAVPLGAAIDVSGLELASMDEIQHRVRVVVAVARRWPFGDTCLRRCLAIGLLIRTHEPRLHLGVRRNESGEITAHSWLVVGGRSIDPASAAYAPLML